MELPKPFDGTIYIKRKSDGKILNIPEGIFNAERHILVDYLNPGKEEVTQMASKVPAQVPPGLLREVSEAKIQYTREQLSLYSAKQIKALPEFKELKEAFFRSKEDLLDACMKIQKGEVLKVEDNKVVDLTEEVKPVELPKE